MHIQGQIYHLLGALLPLPEADHQFLQIYFMGNTEAEVNRHCVHNPTVKRTIVQELQTFIHQNNFVKMFKISLNQMPSDNHNVFILDIGECFYFYFIYLFFLLIFSY